MINLQDIPSSGMNKWLPLDKVDAKSKRRRGDIHVGLLLSTDRDQDLTSQEHKNLLKMLFTHELQSSPVRKKVDNHHQTGFETCSLLQKEQPFCWNGSFSREAVTILGQHAVQGKLTGAETALARWLVYAHTHCDLPLDYRVFHPILDQLKFAIHNNLLHQEDVSFKCVLKDDHDISFHVQRRRNDSLRLPRSLFIIVSSLSGSTGTTLAVIPSSWSSWSTSFGACS